MKKIVYLYVVFILSLCSCITEKKRAEICRTCTLQDSLTDKVTIKDSVVKKPVEKLLPIVIHDSIPYWLPNPCADLCDSLGRLKNFTKDIKSDKGATLRIYTKDNKIFFQDRLDSLKQLLKIKDTLLTHYINKDHFRSEVKSVPARCQLEHLTKLDSFFIISGRLLLVALLAFLGYNAVKYYMKFHKPF